MQRLLEILALPTAPFREERVADYVRAFAAGRGLPCESDAAGNLYVRYRRGRPARRWFFTAHMDHPGFVAVARRGRQLQAEFRGSVPREYFRGQRVRFPAGDGPAGGVVTSVRAAPGGDFLRASIRLDRAAGVPPGAAGAWELPPPRRRGERIDAPACDDLAGVAAVLDAIERLRRGQAAADVTGLLTRAEEVGFVGAMAAVRGRRIPRSALVVGIETSKAQPQAKLGGGVVIRVGDRARIFDAPLSAHLARVAAEQAAKDPGFRHTRALMPGGVCESTVFHLAGLRAAAVCVPLGNYHNCGPRLRIRPERIHAGDYRSLVTLLAALAESPADPADTDRALRRRLDERYRRLAPLLA